MTHPLTNKKLFKKFWDYTVDADLMGQVFYTPDGMRVAFDKGRDDQLERCLEFLRTHPFHERDDYDWSDANAYAQLMEEAMRPTQEKN